MKQNCDTCAGSGLLKSSEFSTGKNSGTKKEPTKVKRVSHQSMTSGGRFLFEDDEVRELFVHLKKGWKIVNGKQLEKEFLFNDFTTALKFVNSVGKIAEKEGHHPDIYLSWGKVKIVLWTHSVNGLTEKDFRVATKIDKIKNN